jgi:NHL repeat-containing protein
MSKVPVAFSRRRLLQTAALAACAPLAGCIGGSASSQVGQLDKVWGKRGSTEGRFNKPRAVTIDKEDHLYIVDMTPRIQIFTPDGEYLRGWQTPDYKNGKPSGLSIDNSGNLLVSDTHYYRVLTYTPQGELLADRTLGGTWGDGPGQFHFVTDCVQDPEGNFYVSEYGECDRIQKFTPDRKFLYQWGNHGHELGEFLRPQKMVLDQQGFLWVTDACNHRVQMFDVRGSYARIVKSWGRQGRAPGELNYPYDILLDEAGLAGRDDGHVYLCEFGNHRVQKFTLDGQFVGLWGESGRREGQLDQPWGITRDSRGRMYVLDSYNHRVQRFWL